MTKEETQEKLAKITKDLIAEEVDYFLLKKAVEDLKSLLEKLSKLNFEAAVNSENIVLPTGKAIGTKWAAMCLEDLMRTHKFMKGINKAVQTVLKKNTEKPVTILYAGTGPYATLILPLLSLYKPSELQLVLLEVNPVSIKSLKQIIKSFDALDYVKAIYHCDASNFIIPPEIDVDILLIECMQHALLREPQVAITYNLLPQIKKEAILIPEKISLHLALIDTKKKIENQSITDSKNWMDFYTNSEAIFTLNKDEVLKNNLEFKKIDFQFPIKETIFSKEQLQNHDTFATTTEITVFENNKLNINESGLTIPLLLADLTANPTLVGAKTQYLANEDPKLATEIIHS